MKSRITISCDIVLSGKSKRSLDETVAAYGAAVAQVVDAGIVAGTAGNARLHHMCYRDIRSRHSLNANHAIRAIARAAVLLKAASREMATTHELDFDSRLCRIVENGRSVSLATIHGRIAAALPISEIERRKLSASRLVKATVEARGDGVYKLALIVTSNASSPEIGEQVVEKEGGDA